MLDKVAMTIRTDRSRIVAYRNCPRLRYWQYEWDGTGLEPVAMGLPLAFGIGLHEAFALLLQGAEPEAVVGRTRWQLQDLWEERGLKDGAHALPAFFMAEQQWLAEALIWAWLAHRYPVLRETYEVVATEHELQWEMAPGVIDMVRVDAVVRRRDDGALFYLEWKTVGAPGEEWLKSWTHNSQFLANVLALEETLQVRIDGVLIEGIVKGRRLVETAKTAWWLGERVQETPLCYGWATPGGLSPHWTSGARKVALWETGLTAQAWVAGLDARALAKVFAPAPPIMPRREHLDRWRRQAVLQETRIAEAMATTPVPMDRVFPLNDDHCFRYWGHPCPFEPLCFTAQIEEAPLDSGLYQRRVPHHAEGDGDDAGGQGGDVGRVGAGVSGVPQPGVADGGLS